MEHFQGNPPVGLKEINANLMDIYGNFMDIYGND